MNYNYKAVLLFFNLSPAVAWPDTALFVAAEHSHAQYRVESFNVTCLSLYLPTDKWGRG